MNTSLYFITGILLAWSFYKDQLKTKKALKKAWKSFENIMPQFLGVIILVGLVLSVFDTEFTSRLIGAESGWLGTFMAAVVGSITLIPGFIAFPTAALLVESGAGYMQIGAFVSTLMMVGVVTIPIEIKYFGKKMTLLRNIMAFAFSFLVAFIIMKVVSL
jgi:uncharacterized membrane protein YraQ (UPF0718 family)